MRKFLMAAVAATVMAMPANAVILSGTLSGGSVVTAGGVFQKTTLSNVEVNTINSKNVLGIDEAQYVTLASALRVFNVNVATGDTPAGTTGSILLAPGTVVSSHLIILDPTNNQIAQGGGGTNASGSVTFNGPILGYIFIQGANANTRGGANFIASNYLGASGTTYGPLHATLEGGADAVSFSGNTLTFTLESGRTVGDYLRVFTAVPEPKSWAMLLVGFGLVGFAARRRGAAVTA